MLTECYIPLLYLILGMPAATKTDECSKKFQMAFDPPTLILELFRKFIRFGSRRHPLFGGRERLHDKLKVKGGLLSVNLVTTF